MATFPPNMTHTGSTPGNATMRRAVVLPVKQAATPVFVPVRLFHTGEDPPARVQQTNRPVPVATPAPYQRF